MNSGIVAELSELLALQNYVANSSSRPPKASQKRGNHLSRLRGRGMEFAEVRNYQAGDEIRHMEWRVTARTGRAHIKVYQEEREQAFFLLVDFNPSMYFGTRIALKSVTAARLAALLAWTAVKQGDRVGAFLYSDKQHQEFPPLSREAGVLPLLASLSAFTKQEKGPARASNPPETIVLEEELLRLRRVAKPGSLLMIISDFYQFNEECVKHLARLVRHNDVIAYHVCDVLELAPPKPGNYPISNGVEETVLDLFDPRARIAYESWAKERLSFLQSQCRRLNVPYVQVLAEDALPQLVRQTLARRLHG